MMLLSRTQLHAKEHNDAKLMVKVLKTVIKNLIPLQPGTADIVFRYVSIIRPFEFCLSDSSD